MGMALVVAAATVIGLGIVIWCHREHSSDKPSATIRCGDRKDLGSSVAYSHSPPTLRNDNATPATQYTLNDTSLVALVLEKGDPQLFFQKNTGLVRCAIRTASNSQWSTSPISMVDSKREELRTARSHYL